MKDCGGVKECVCVCRFHKIKRRRSEKLGNKTEVTEEELVKLRAKVSAVEGPNGRI